MSRQFITEGKCTVVRSVESCSSYAETVTDILESIQERNLTIVRHVESVSH